MKRQPAKDNLPSSERELVQIAVGDVLIRKRIRKNLGDLTLLMDSMRRHGLLNPIVITRDRQLVAGHRRLEAARRLGWQRITASIIDTNQETALLEVEIDENTQRKNLSTDELADAYIRLDRLKNPGLFKKIWQAIVSLFRKIFRRGKK
ncbi:MAG: ParB N-terminal domain-containing protein [Spirochaetaceae bacterium]